VLLKLWLDVINTGRKDLLDTIKRLPGEDVYKKIVWKVHMSCTSIVNVHPYHRQHTTTATETTK